MDKGPEKQAHFEEPVRVRAAFDPVMNISAWFLHFQKHVANGYMNFLQAAAIAREYPESSPDALSPPPAPWNLLSRILAPIGRLLGYEAC